MKYSFLFMIIGALYSCSNSPEKNTNAATGNTEETAAFFPVTNYLRGQVSQVKTLGVNPLRIVKQKDKLDSSWLKIEEIDSALAIFLHPEIDSTSMAELFAESKFHDRSINSYTFTYEPKTALPDSIGWRRWDVYVTPQTGNVRKLYLEKQVAANKNVQLTWEDGSHCKLVWFTMDQQGNPALEKEETIKWTFEEEQ